LKYEPQVPKGHYYEGYDYKGRWMNYWYQIQEVLKTNPRTVLEVGIGNGTVSVYLKKRGINVTTVDIDPDLMPDYVSSVTALTQVCCGKVFDTVLCAEVLEHLKFEDFHEALKQIRNVCGNWAVLTLPQQIACVNLSVKLPLLNRFDLFISTGYPSSSVRISNEHYWEIGMKGYALKRVLEGLNQYFQVMSSYTILENYWSRLFLLRPKRSIDNL
jgi:SAM-dependent methyltransferase